MINLLLLNNFYPYLSYHTSSKESDKLLYTRLVTRYGPRNQLPTQGVNRRYYYLVFTHLFTI